MALDLNAEALTGMGRAVVPDFARFAAPELRHQLSLLRNLAGNKLGVFAYCFCEIR